MKSVGEITLSTFPRDFDLTMQMALTSTVHTNTLVLRGIGWSCKVGRVNLFNIDKGSASNREIDTFRAVDPFEHCRIHR